MSEPFPFDQDQVVKILAEAREMSGGERRAYLEKACGGDQGLHQWVQTLLAALPNPKPVIGAPNLQDESGCAGTLAIENNLARSGQVLGHYRLEKLLGSGGMGEVYSAKDLALDRIVAIKLLRASVDPNLRARLSKESAASARIEHPAVATFYEHGQEGDTDYLAMEYVEGETLRDFLRKDTFSPDQTLALIFALLDALVHAHAKGIVHRDIKPENIMVTPQGTPKLLDFGIAKEIRLLESEDEMARTAAMLTALTGPGFILGTPGYMSPEQLRGEVVSAQTDIFAIGAVLYEMLAGEAAFPGSTAQERMGSTLYRDIPNIDLDGLHWDINAVLSRALARNSKDRYPNAAAFIRDLRDLESGVRLAVLPNTVAILDLENLAHREEDDWIGIGIAESLGADLGRMTGLELVPRNKVLGGAAALVTDAGCPDPVALGLALGCRWILTGTYQKIGPRLRLTVRFVEVATGVDLWVEKLDGEIDLLFEMQDRLAQITAESLNLTLPEDEDRKQDLSVHELYSKGRKVLTSLKSLDIPYAKELFEKAIEIDPDFSPALSGLAGIHAPSLWAGSADPALLRKSEDLARRAINSDPKFGEAYLWLGYSLWRQGEFEPAANSLETAEKLDPTNPLPSYFQGTLHCELGNWDTALTCFLRSCRIDDNSVYALTCLGHVHALLGNFSEAEWIYTKTMELVKGGDVMQWSGVWHMMAECYQRQGKVDEAWILCKELLVALEESDHQYRSVWRVTGLQLLAEIAVARGELPVAEVAINQAIEMSKAQSAGPTKGHIMVQSLALKSIIGSSREIYREAVVLEKNREGFDFSWGPITCEDRTCYILARAALHHEEQEDADTYYSRAKAAGCLLSLH